MEFGHCTNETNRLATFLSSWYCSWKKNDWLHHHFHFLSTECHFRFILSKEYLFVFFLFLFFFLLVDCFSDSFIHLFILGLNIHWNYFILMILSIKHGLKKKKENNSWARISTRINYFLFLSSTHYLFNITKPAWFEPFYLVLIGKIWTVLRT